MYFALTILRIYPKEIRNVREIYHDYMDIWHMPEALKSNMERVIFSVNGVETTRYLHRKNETGLPISYCRQEPTSV